MRPARELHELRKRVRELKVEIHTERAKGAGAAYEDCAQRLGVVEKKYDDDFDTSAALRELAHGFEHPVREMEASVGRLHMRALVLDRERHT